MIIMGTVQDALNAMNSALCYHKQAYASFLALGKSKDFVNAEKARLNVVASIESVMDSYMAACLIQDQAEREGDG